MLTSGPNPNKLHFPLKLIFTVSVFHYLACILYNTKFFCDVLQNLQLISKKQKTSQNKVW